MNILGHPRLAAGPTKSTSKDHRTGHGTSGSGHGAAEEGGLGGDAWMADTRALMTRLEKGIDGAENRLGDR